MDFIIPAGFRNGDKTEFGGYTEDHTNDTTALQRIQSLGFLQMSIIIENGGYPAVGVSISYSRVGILSATQAASLMGNERTESMSRLR